MKRIDDLRQLLARATRRPWSWWTSNSFRRLSSDATGRDGDVASGVIQRSDGHPDIAIREEDMALVVGAVNALELLLNVAWAAERFGSLYDPTSSSLVLFDEVSHALRALHDGVSATATSTKSDGLTHAEIAVACRNVGIDLSCDACAEVFYTGSAMHEHTHEDGLAAERARTDALVKALPRCNLDHGGSLATYESLVAGVRHGNVYCDVCAKELGQDDAALADVEVVELRYTPALRAILAARVKK